MAAGSHAPSVETGFWRPSLPAPRIPGRKEYVVLGIIKARVALLGLLGLLLVGLLAPAAASATAGPFCYHRALGGQGKGEIIKAQAPEPFEGSGGAQTLNGKMGETEFELSSAAVQVKGVIYNNAFQCQAKITLQYQEIKLAKPEIAGCTVTVGETGNNVVELLGHQAWTWDGTEKQLLEHPQQNQKPDWIFLKNEIAENATELPAGEFTKINFGAKCGVLSGIKIKVAGSDGAESKPANLGEWGTEEEISSGGGELQQHFWNGKAAVGVKTGLTVGGSAAKYKGVFKIAIQKRQQLPIQEIAHWET